MVSMFCKQTRYLIFEFRRVELRKPYRNEFHKQFVILSRLPSLPLQRNRFHSFDGNMVRRIGIIGYGNLGKFLALKILADKDYDLVFVWNRTKSVFQGSDCQNVVLDDIIDFATRKPDLVVEVAHPSITKAYGTLILKYCDYMIGSPTALSDEVMLKDLRNAATVHGLYVPSGAFWGGEDIRKMSEAGILSSLSVTMKKHPLSLKLQGHLKEKNAEVKSEAVTLYHGCVKGICLDAPHNTNTMAAAAIAAPNLGFEGVIGNLISDPSLVNYHIVEVEAYGYPKQDGSCFHVRTIRRNPAVLGEVTGDATFSAYFGSLKRLTQAEKILCSCPRADVMLLEQMRKLGCRTTTNNEHVANDSRVLILAVKPPIVPKVLKEVSQCITPQHLVISVAMGITTRHIEQSLPAKSRVIRVMPNTPALVREGASVFSCGSSTLEEDAVTAHTIFSSVGTCDQIEEGLLDAVTGLSGSGPAYMFMAIEALADGGVKMGIRRELALKLAAQTLLGAAKMVLETGKHPGSLKDDVCSPAGTSIQAVHLLEKHGFRSALISAVEAGTQRSKETGGLF